MKRTIKFRGKAKKDGEWFYGNLFDKDTSGRTHICTTTCGCLDIDPETVGQFTGLYDKNGKEIYEGDILQLHGKEVYIEVYFSEYFACFRCKRRIGRSMIVVDDRPLFIYAEDKCYEIIDNVYDNPELLKGGK